MGGLGGGEETHLERTSLHRVVRRTRSARKPAGPRPADQCGRPGGGGEPASPFRLGAGGPAPLNVATSEHSKVATRSRGAGRLSGKRRARRRGRAEAPPRSASASTRPAPRALRPAACVLAREPALPPCPCAARVWSCCAARAPGTRPGPGRTRGCWGTSVSCRACSAWKSATCPAPLTSSVCRGRSSRTCGRCWRTGCWRYRPEGLPSPATPASPAPDIPGPPCRDILVPTTISKMFLWRRSPGPGLSLLSLGHPTRLPPWCLFLSLLQP